ncbi:MAG: glycosyltransferase family 39 protein [Isosphaeraceae bacterium]
MSITRQGARIGLLMAATAALLYWASHHAEVAFPDGVRFVRQAERIDRGDLAAGLWQSIDHPMHPLAIAAAHQVLKGEGPYAWQTAAQAASVVMLVLAVVPIYLLGRELFESDDTAALGCLLVMAGPVATDVAVNVLSETTFLLFWAWGLWGASRFLRNGRFGWLIPAIGFGALAYLTRPEGLLIHVGLVATLLALPMLPGIHILWPRWWAAVGVLVLGPLALVGPYMAAKGGLATKPAVARLIGAEPVAPPEALERERPLPPDQSAWQTYAVAGSRVFRAIRGAVTPPLAPFAALGLVLASRKLGRRRARAWLFVSLVGLIAIAGLVRLHATGGYCTVRHALIPGTILTMAAAHGMIGLMRSVAFDGRWLGLGEGRVRPGPAVWALVIAGVVIIPLYLQMKPFNSSFAPYRMAGSWIESHAGEGAVLDLTDWSLFFSRQNGAGFPNVLEAAEDPDTRFLVVRDGQLEGHLHYNEVVRNRVAGRRPVASFPEKTGPRQIRLSVYDLAGPIPADVAEGSKDTEARLR